MIPKHKSWNSSKYKKLQPGVIEPKICKWAALTLLELKNDGKLRFCVDYRKLDIIKVRETYRLPFMDEFIDSLGQA